MHRWFKYTKLYVIAKINLNEKPNYLNMIPEVGDKTSKMSEKKLRMYLNYLKKEFLKPDV